MNDKTRNAIKRRMIIAITTIFVVGFTAYIYAGNAIAIYDLEQQKTQIEQKIENEKIRSNQLDEQVKQMGKKNYVEYFARKYLGLYYPDETIVIVETQENATESGGQTGGK